MEMVTKMKQRNWYYFIGGFTGLISGLVVTRILELEAEKRDGKIRLSKEILMGVSLNAISFLQSLTDKNLWKK